VQNGGDFSSAISSEYLDHLPALQTCLLRARWQLREQLARSFRPGLASIEETLLGDPV
jgi:hypothetical protein